MRKISILILASLLIIPNLKADEGMWLPMLIKRLNQVDMQKMGLQLTPEEIYSVNSSCVKDAIVGLADPKYPTDFFCTAEIISKDGLVLTNHHCAFDVIQAQSTVEKDYLKNGFWAKSKNEELPAENIAAVMLVRMEDVSQKVLADITDDMSELARDTKVQEHINNIVIETEKLNPQYKASVKGFFFGNEYYLFVYQVYKDVRLVGTPPSSIGKFGGDTDNWMWPRHTGDFSLLRIYTGNDGSGSEYHLNNIPLKPKYSLPISNRHIAKDEFTMTLGYPAKTDRYMFSYGVDMNTRITYPTTVDIRSKKLSIMEEAMSQDAKIRIQYSSKQANTANYWKYFIGADKQLEKNHVYQIKKTQELNFARWVAEDPFRIKRYGNIIARIDSAYQVINKFEKNKTFIEEAILQGPEIIYFTFGFSSYASNLFHLLKDTPENTTAIQSESAQLKKSSEKYFKDYDPQVDQRIFSSLLKFYAESIDKDQIPEELKSLKNKTDFDAWSKELYKTSIFSDYTRLSRFLDKPNIKTLEKDPIYKIMESVISKYFDISAQVSLAEFDLNEASRYYVEALRKIDPDKKFYSDANSTMRLSYGKVADYSPYDAISYNYFTTLNGLLQKEDTTKEEFIVPQKLKELYKNKEFGSYGENGDIRVCFTTNNDITGGNSGSPVINNKGELIGIAFDGNWEAMSGDIAYNDKIQRSIAVDIRYILFIIDKYAGAKNIINELEIRN